MNNICRMKHIELEYLPPEAFDAPDDTDDIFPFLFPTMEKRREKVPSIIAQRWKDSSHYWFFYNGFCSKRDIHNFLKAQNIVMLDTIAASFDVESIDLISERRRKEGETISQSDRNIIIETILSSITI